MIRAIHDCLRYRRRGCDVLQTTDCGCAFRRTVHTARVQLDGLIRRVELDDLDARHNRFQRIGALREHVVRDLDRRAPIGVFAAKSIRRGNHYRLAGERFARGVGDVARDDRGQRMRKRWNGETGGCGSAGTKEVTTGR